MSLNKFFDLTEEEKEEIFFKKYFGGIPTSVMQFDKSPELMDFIDDTDSVGIVRGGTATPRGGGYAKNMRYSIYNPTQAEFILKYYTEEGWDILDPFAGRGTRSLMSLRLGRNYYGIDVCIGTVQDNIRKIEEKNFGNKKWEIKVGDGTRPHEVFPNQTFDAIFTCPPYYNIEKYSGNEGDLSHLSDEGFERSIGEMFQNLKGMVKKSNYKEKRFHPIIFTVGTVRRGERGLLDMDSFFQGMAKNCGFTLHDKLITVNRAPGAGFTFRRNWDYKFLCKTHETTLIFLDYEDEHED
jgi:DNA modification methylase